MAQASPSTNPIQQALRQCLEVAFESSASKQNLTADRCIWVAYSGGLDSSVLLHELVRLRECAQAKQQSDFLADISIRAIHVHHGLSDNADAWAQHCQIQCQVYLVPLKVVRVQLNDTTDGIEQAARRARYRVFESLCSDNDILLMAHHADDQLETLMMRLTRGSGLQGLAGVPAQRRLSLQSNTRLMRPLLGLTRAQLQACAEAQNLTWIEDESNQDTRFERNWWRQVALPLLWQKFPGRRASTLGSARRLQQDAEALDWLLQPHLQDCLAENRWPRSGKQSLKIDKLMARPESVRGHLIRHWLAGEGEQLPSADWLDALMRDLIAAEEDAQPQLVLGSRTVRRYQNQLYLVSPLQIHTELKSERLASQMIWCGGVIRTVDLSAQNQALFVDNQPLPAIGDHLQLLRAADLSSQQARLKVQGRPTKKLKHIWQESGVPVWLREDWPVLVKDGQLVALVGLEGWLAAELSEPVCKQLGRLCWQPE
ncbi:MAG: tRNA lysidine(34) synthetase TilS [Oceanobacter sp.]